jgi:hypothetical protein
MINHHLSVQVHIPVWGLCAAGQLAATGGKASASNKCDDIPIFAVLDPIFWISSAVTSSTRITTGPFSRSSHPAAGSVDYDHAKSIDGHHHTGSLDERDLRASARLSGVLEAPDIPPPP